MGLKSLGGAPGARSTVLSCPSTPPLPELDCRAVSTTTRTPTQHPSQTALQNATM
ncbi:hypothetical protein SAY86_014850 [Trapa natans]|uniref:Uncharacterized protein n=1 Tax=Trapa natans TaxID=22666 RepID=A0AAN7KHW9_TRANT|nr:hypothetical protein SAY86_014850 [Trapa natans]